MMPMVEAQLDASKPREDAVEAPLSVALALAAPADLTLPEAAALRDEAEVLRQIRHGVDPNLAGRVRRGVIRDEEYLLTPLEAATAARHGEVVRLLVGNGAELNDTNVPILFCLAQRSGAADIVSLLNEHAPVDARADYDSVRLPL